MIDLFKLKLLMQYFILKMTHILYVSSDYGLYNNKTLDMKFTKDVKAIMKKVNYIAEKAEYSKFKRFLKISDNVRIID